MDTFSPPNLIHQTNVGDRFSAHKQTQIADAINRMNNGVQTPQIRGNVPPLIVPPQNQVMAVVGTDNNFLYCVTADQWENYSLAGGVYSGPPLLPVWKPLDLTYNWYSQDVNDNFIFTYDDTGNATFVFSLTPSGYNLNSDGNSRNMVRSDTSDTEIQVLSAPYASGVLILASTVAQNYRNTGNPYNTLSGWLDAVSGGSGYMVCQSGSSQESIPIPAYALNKQVTLFDLNADARHWCAQSVT